MVVSKEVSHKRFCSAMSIAPLFENADLDGIKDSKHIKVSRATSDKHQKHLCPILAHQTIASAHSSFIVLINYKKFMIFLETSSRSLLHSNIQACAPHGAISILQILFFKVEENAWSCVPSIPYCCQRISRSRMVRGTNSSFIFETIGSSVNANIDNVLVKCS